jgi:hypothetical protein
MVVMWGAKMALMDPGMGKVWAKGECGGGRHYFNNEDLEDKVNDYDLISFTYNCG